ncbi:FadR/GntR family transcriptional regulator [Maribacter hydrothermalis]|uniref:GntR family transcriptional regulator n=1 Tax=Maribacter hydrothermalis TaxID=1836467 RepID=A0A1B7YXQ6_9FLAO|nr:FCD domain-containing protein [Maribacter hydrothermalis]APQ16739.1 GntR family transcriptional regulator [Maribacter hydrothermalis]OBR35166.1 GntR family transcriptional regulator [Maribacter hydrothermalis]
MKKFKKLAPVDTGSLVDKVEIRLLAFFKDNNLKAGDAIPKELEFAESLGVSRTVVREALLRLRTLGLVESKKHRGMILKQPDIINNFERIMDPTLLGEDTMRQLFELRLILEMGMADFLFEHKTQKDMDELEAIVKAEESSSSGKIRFTLDKEVAFHGKLYEMSKNTTLLKFQNLLLPVFDYVYLKETKNTDLDAYHFSGGKFVSHRMLFENLKVGTPETFRNAMRRHLEPHFDHAFKANGDK